MIAEHCPAALQVGLRHFRNKEFIYLKLQKKKKTVAAETDQGTCNALAYYFLPPTWIIPLRYVQGFS